MEKGMQMKRSKLAMKVGPWGGEGGMAWDDGDHSGVREITLLYGQCIHSVRFHYDSNGRPLMAHRHGGSDGNRTAQVFLNYPEEFLTAVSGHYSSVPGGGGTADVVVRSLTFASNLRQFGPYGVEEGTPFSLPMKGAMVVGFHSRSGRHLNAIGCSLSPACAPNVFNRMQLRVQRKMDVLRSRSSGSAGGTLAVVPCLYCKFATRDESGYGYGYPNCISYHIHL